MMETDEEQMAFSFYEEEKPAIPAEDQFESEDEAFDTHLEQKTACGQEAWKEEGWTPCDPADPSDAAAARRLENRDPGIASCTLAEDPVSYSSAAPSVPQTDEAEEPVAVPVKRPVNPFSPALLRRAALGFLASRKPSGIAEKVTAVCSGISIDAASFTLIPVRAGLPEVKSVSVVVVAVSPEKCMIPEKQRLKWEAARNLLLQKKAELEALIREKEPHLNASLFAETAVWEYEHTRDRRYHACIKKLAKLDEQLSAGGKLERLTSDAVADNCYLLIPEGTALPGHIPENWGILSADTKLNVQVIKEACALSIPAENRTGMALKIAAAGIDPVLFASGITISQGIPSYHFLPRKRKKALL